MGNSPVSIREINQQRILNLVRQNPGISRASIVKTTNLGKATVSTIVSNFIEAGVISEVGTTAQRAPAGRRPVKLELNRQVRLAIGVELTGSECVAVITDLYGEPLNVVRLAMKDSTVETSLDVVEEAVNQLLEGFDRSNWIGLGVGVPGPVDVSRQHVIQAVNLGWLNVPFGPLLSERIHKPVIVLKRQNAGAIGEHRNGIGKAITDLIFISVGVGIGSGIIVGGELQEGVDGSSGEIGHITIIPDGHRCNCGGFGCLETLASCPAIVLRARERSSEGRESLLTEKTNGVLQLITSEMVMEAAIQGDSLAIEIVQEAARYLGIAIANVIKLFNPGMVIIGGDMLELGDLYFNPIRETIQRRTTSIPTPVGVLPSSLGDRAAPIGAACLVIDQFFAQPDPFALSTSSD